jgi:alkylation response protein AidB-like acyl-CoA dehydrogenase
VILQNCRVPASALIGEEGQGFLQTLQVLDAGRIGIAALAVGLAQGACEASRSYAFQRRQFGRPIGTFQAIRWKLVEGAARVEAARLLTYRAAWAKDSGAERVTLESAMAKSFATEAAQRIVDDAVQIVGGRGVLAEHPVDRLYRCVRALRIYEGTTEIQQLLIAERLLADRGGGDRA